MNIPISTPGIIIKKHQLGESDLIVTVLTRKFGKIKAVSRHARKSIKRFMGGLDIFDCGVFDFQPPRGGTDLYRLEAISARVSWPALRTDLTKFTLASFCLEISDQFFHEGEAEAGDSFNPLYLTMDKLNKLETKAELVAVTSFFLLLTLYNAGISPLAQEQALSDTSATWCQAMLEQNAPAVAGDKILMKTCLHELLSFTENELGFELKTKHELFIELERGF